MSASNEWSPNPPDAPGWWWLLGEEEFGVMGGHFSGSIPPTVALHAVDVMRIGNAGGSAGTLLGVCGGRSIPLTPYDPKTKKPGYIGRWRKMDIPAVPMDLRFLVTTKDFAHHVPGCDPLNIPAGTKLVPAAKPGSWQLAKTFGEHPWMVSPSTLLEEIVLNGADFVNAAPVPYVPS